jgi:hypothetical protein
VDGLPFGFTAQVETWACVEHKPAFGRLNLPQQVCALRSRRIHPLA